VDNSRLELSGDLTGSSPRVGGANEATGGSGGAFHVTNGSEVRLSGVFVGSVATGNSATEDGGGLYADASTIVLRDTQVVGNGAIDDGGGIYVGNGSDLRMDTSYSGPSFTSCDPWTLPAGRYCSEIRDNEAGGWGSGIYVDQSTATILDTAFLDNEGLSGGTSPGDAILVSGGAVEVTNGLISGNGANENSAVHLYTDAVYTSTHSTYAGNGDSPLFVVSTARALLAKNIMWDNGDDAFYQPGASVTASCNDTENLLTGPGNISTSPHFVTTTRGSYRLGPGSPARDVCAAGVDHDLDDVRRPIDADGVASPTEHDMGAFEGWIPVFLPTVLADG
jgi:predicted outer membrane repeat protein